MSQAATSEDGAPKSTPRATTTPRLTRSRRAVSVTGSSPTAPTRERKAPTPLAVASLAHNRNRFSLVTMGAIFVASLAVSVGIGLLDPGHINVEATVTNQNNKINRGEVLDNNGQVTTKNIPVQNPDSRPNGGLHQSTGLNQSTALPATAPVATNTNEVPATATSAATSVSSSTESATPAAATDGSN